MIPYNRQKISNQDIRSVVKVLKSIGQREVTDQHKLIQKLCFKYDKHREFKIIPVFEKKVEDFWLYD